MILLFYYSLNKDKSVYLSYNPRQKCLRAVYRASNLINREDRLVFPACMRIMNIWLQDEVVNLFYK